MSTARGAAFRRAAVGVGALVLLLVVAGRARAADVVIAAGAEYTLTADIVLAGADSFAAGDPDPAAARCKIHGGGFSIHTDATEGVPPWTGNFVMNNCDVDGLGAPHGTAINLTGSNVITVQGSTFSTSSQIAFYLSGAAAVTFNRNTINADSTVVNVPMSLLQSQDVFYVQGNSTGTKVFQGNRVFKARLLFENTNDWLIGGDNTLQDGNVLSGDRTGIAIHNCGTMTIRGNYSHTQGTGNNEVKNLNVLSGGNTIVEHNIFIESDWNLIVDSPGEIRYNLIVNPVQRGWVIVWATSPMKVHHNLLIQTRNNQSNTIKAGIAIYKEDDPVLAAGPTMAEVYANTFDAGGVCNPGLGGAVMMDGALASLRSNAFINIRLPMWTGTTLVGLGTTDVPVPPPNMLLYADYNLFFNMVDNTVKSNYNVGVAGKTMRTDPGFGYHDVHVGGPVNEQVDPKLPAKIPHVIPYTEQSVIDRQTSVCQILAYFRQAYTPTDGSPLIDAGDPQDGPGADIGAIGAGMPNDLDLFGRLCDPSDVGTPDMSASVFTCPSVPIQVSTGGGSGGTGVVVPMNHGFACVCNAGAGAPSAPGLAAFAITTALALLGRRRRTRD